MVNTNNYHIQHFFPKGENQYVATLSSKSLCHTCYPSQRHKNRIGNSVKVKVAESQMEGLSQGKGLFLS